MDKIEIGDVFVEQDHREHGRMLKVLGVFLPGTYSLDEGYVACSSKGKVTVMSYDRLMNPSRFRKYAQEVPHLSYGG